MKQQDTTMSESEIQLKDIRYHGDHPQDYSNPTFRGDSDVEGGSYPTKGNGPHVHSEVNGNQPPATDEFDPTKTGTYELGQPTEDEDEDGKSSNSCLRCIDRAHESVGKCLKERKNIYVPIIVAALVVVYAVYFGFAMAYELGSEDSIRLLWVTCVVVFFILLNVIWHFCGARIKECCGASCSKAGKHERLISWILVAALFLAVIIFVFVDVFVNTKQYYNLVSAVGILIFVLVMFIFSKHPGKVQWRAVAWGLGLQFLFAILILRWRGGYIAFKWLGDRVATFLDYSDVGAAFLFGDNFRVHYFAFKILPTIIFFSTVISILYYWGVMQVIVHYIAVVMQFAMGTTAGESLNAAGNIFVGQTEAPLMIRPLLPSMTRSEIHAVMTGGFATIAGGVFAAYIGFGVPANHLISASVMSAPAALAMAKLFYPETKKSKTKAEDVKKLPKGEDVNFLAAAANGASQSITLVANVAVNLIAFISLLAFVDTTLTWFGHRVGWYDPELTFNLICSYVLFPIPLIMGVDLDNCRQVAQLIGVKTFLNEFVAYIDLGKLIDNRAAFDSHIALNGTYFYKGDNIMLEARPGFNATELTGGILSVRSEVIATYALCGFANVGSIGIQLGGLGAIAPERKDDLAAVALRAMIAGNVACFMTACIAGLFYQGELNA